MSTGRCHNASRSHFNPATSTKLRPGSIWTKKSTSLSAPASPRARDPNNAMRTVHVSRRCLVGCFEPLSILPGWFVMLSLLSPCPIRSVRKATRACPCDGLKYAVGKARCQIRTHAARPCPVPLTLEWLAQVPASLRQSSRGKVGDRRRFL